MNDDVGAALQALAETQLGLVVQRPSESVSQTGRLSCRRIRYFAFHGIEAYLLAFFGNVTFV